jgi:hypothetical protein
LPRAAIFANGLELKAHGCLDFVVLLSLWHSATTKLLDVQECGKSQQQSDQPG